METLDVATLGLELSGYDIGIGNDFSPISYELLESGVSLTLMTVSFGAIPSVSPFREDQLWKVSWKPAVQYGIQRSGNEGSVSQNVVKQYVG